MRGQNGGHGRRDAVHAVDEQARQPPDTPESGLGGQHPGPSLVEGHESGDLERPLMPDECLESMQRHVGRYVDQQRPSMAAKRLSHRVIDLHGRDLQLSPVACKHLGLPG